MSRPYPDSLLTYVDPSDVSIVVGGWPQAIGRELALWHSHDSVRVVRGFRMRTWEALFGEFSAAFQLPLYFGYNLEALTESLSEPDQEPIREPCICLIVDADLVLADEDPRELPKLVRALSATRLRWHDAPPEHLQGVDPVFSIVIVPDQNPEPVRQAWTAAGALLTEVQIDPRS